MSSVFLFLLTLGASAEPVTLLEETKAIECGFENKHAEYDRVVIDAKDTKLTAYKGKDIVLEYARNKFLDSALLLKSKKNPQNHALFQILLNGEVWLHEGDLLPFFEHDCDDTGASKTCKTDVIHKLFWSPERLTLEYAKGKIHGAVDGYGYLANHATYFRAKDRAKKTLTLIDYGSALDLIAGAAYLLKCHYL